MNHNRKVQPRQGQGDGATDVPACASDNCDPLLSVPSHASIPTSGFPFGGDAFLTEQPPKRRGQAHKGQGEEQQDDGALE